MNQIRNLVTHHKVFIKYLASAGASFALDIILFTMFLMVYKNFMGDFAIILATICARIISSFFNYFLNRNAVFKVEGKNKTDKLTFIKYYILMVVNMIISSMLVLGIFRITEFNETLIKIPIDVLIFISNYFIQKMFIFKKE